MAGVGDSGNFNIANTSTNTKSNTISNADSTSQQDQTQTQTGSTQQTGTQQAVTQNIDPALQGLVNQAAGTLSNTISGADFDALKSESVREFNLTTQQQIDTATQQYGSFDNSFVQLLQSNANANLQTQLAALKVNNENAASGSLAALVNASKFGTTTSNVSSTSNTDSLATLLNDITSSSQSSSKVNNETNQNTNSFDFGLGISI